MKFIILTSLLISSHSFARGMNFSCQATYNMQTVLEVKTALANQKISFGGYENFDFLLSKRADGRIELQSYDVSEPSRSYATASIKLPGDYVELSNWNRNYVMNIRCTLLN